MKALLAILLTAPCAATTFTPCPRSIDAPPIRLTIINTQTPGVECAGKTACSEVYETGKCHVWINANATTERDYGAAVRKCFAGRA